MKYLKNKKAQWILFILVVILVPIFYHQIAGVIGAKLAAEARNKPAIVQVAQAEESEIFATSESAGRLEAKYSVDVLARINGWLQKRYFEEGAKIKKGQTLFLIEPDEYQIAVNNAAATVRQTQAALVNSQKELVRAQELVKKDYVSKSYYDQALANRDGAQAAYDAAKAQLSNAKLNLSYTKVTSPIDGKIGKIIITEGNLVNTQSGPLAKIVSVSPIYAYFTLKSKEYINLKQNNESADLSDMVINLQLANGNTYQEEGKIEFIDNEVNESTGTITLRATFQNKDEVLVPGDFVKVTITSKKPKKVLLVPQSAALNDTQGYYVWAVDENNQAVRKNIKVSNEVNKKWIVEDGLTLDDKIIFKGLQSIMMTGQKVNPQPFEEEVEAK